MLGKCSTTELHPSPLFTFYFETDFKEVDRTGLEPTILLHQLPK